MSIIVDNKAVTCHLVQADVTDTLLTDCIWCFLFFFLYEVPTIQNNKFVINNNDLA